MIRLPLLATLCSLAACASNAPTVLPMAAWAPATNPPGVTPLGARRTASESPAPSTPAQQAEPETEQTYGPSHSDFLLTLSGAWSHQTFQLNDAEQTTTQVTAGLSYFLSRAHELGLSFGLQSIETESTFLVGGNPVTEKNKGETIFVNALYNYNFYVTPRTGLYLGPQVGWGRFDSGVSSTSEPQYGVHVGLRHWLHPRVAITVEPQYYFVSFDDDQGGESDVYQILFGLAARL